MTSPVLQALQNAKMEAEPSIFGKWCVARNTRPLPAAPGLVANFIRDVAASGKPMKDIWPLIAEISQNHVAHALADPTCGGAVQDVINSIAMLDRPRSWPKEEEQRWKALPYPTQVYLGRREAERDRAVRNLQNDAARQHQIEKDKNDGTPEIKSSETRADTRAKDIATS